MVVVTGREFRANQAKFLRYASDGEDVILKSRAGSFRISPVVMGDSQEVPRNLVAELRGALQDVKDFLNGETNKLLSWEDMLNELRD